MFFSEQGLFERSEFRSRKAIWRMVDKAMAYNSGMHVLASKLEGLPVMSLQSGETVATILDPIIDMGRLEVVAYQCHIGRGREAHALMSSDIRQLAADCAIIDSEDEVTPVRDVVRLRPLIETRFRPLGKTVITDLGRRVGRIEDYTINLETHCIQKLYVQPPFWQGWLRSNLIIDRGQVLEISPRYITVRDTLSKNPLLAPEPASESQA